MFRTQNDEKLKIINNSYLQAEFDFSLLYSFVTRVIFLLTLLKICLKKIVVIIVTVMN